MYKMQLVEFATVAHTYKTNHRFTLSDGTWGHIYLNLGYLFLGHLATTKQHKQEHSSAQHLNVLAACFST